MTNSDVCKLIVKGYFAQAKDKISHTNIDVNQTDENKRTPLILCAFIEDNSWAISLAQLVLELGAQIDRRDSEQLNVLHYCTIFEQVDLLKMLLDSIDFDIDKGDCFGNSPLMYAIVNDNETITNMLIRYYRRYKINIDKTNSRGINAFMQACLRGNLDIMSNIEAVGIDKYIKDSNGKTSLNYKEDAVTKSEINYQVTECRRQSRMVRFDDIERIIKLQQETINLKSDAQKLPEFIDHNLERMNQLKINLKTIKQNKIDKYYVNKSLMNSINLSGHILMNDNFKIQQIRPQTAFSTSKTLRNRKDWYALLGPMCISLEQKYSTSFNSFTKTGSQNDLLNSNNDKSKGRQRKLSRSTAPNSRRMSITSRSMTNEDSSDSGISTNKSKKKVETTFSAKSTGRNLSRLS